MGNWLLAGILVVALTLSALIPAPADKIVFMDVGQGDAILLQAGGQQIVIDGGPDASVLRRLGEEMPAMDRKIEVLVATHPDKDHIAGLVHVLERYRVDLVILPQVAHTTQLQAAWLTHIQEALNKKNTQYRFAAAGQRIELKDLTLDVLHPEVGEAFGKKTNNASVSMRGEYCAAGSDRLARRLVRPSFSEGGSLGEGGPRSSCLSFLLTGDAEAVIERQLVAKYSPPSISAGRPAGGGEGGGGSILDVDILKAGHHGSKTSTSAALLAAASPSTVVISAGRDNSYGHPHPDVMERLKKYQVWRTDEHGSVSFAHERGQWRLSTSRH